MINFSRHSFRQIVTPWLRSWLLSFFQQPWFKLFFTIIFLFSTLFTVLSPLLLLPNSQRLNRKTRSSEFGVGGGGKRANTHIFSIVSIKNIVFSHLFWLRFFHYWHSGGGNGTMQKLLLLFFSFSLWKFFCTLFLGGGKLTEFRKHSCTKESVFFKLVFKSWSLAT